MRNLWGSPNFSGNFFKITVEKFSFTEVVAKSNNLSLLLRRLLNIKENLGMSKRASAKLSSECRYGQFRIWSNNRLINWSLSLGYRRLDVFEGGRGGETEGPAKVTPLRVVIALRSTQGLGTMLLGSEPEPEEETHHLPSCKLENHLVLQLVIDEISNSGKSLGMRNLWGSPNFSGNFFKITVEKFSFTEVVAKSNNLSLLLRRLLNIKENLGMSKRASAKLSSECRYGQFRIWSNNRLINWSLSLGYRRLDVFEGGRGGETEGPAKVTPLRVVIALRSTQGLGTMLLGSEPEPEEETHHLPSCKLENHLVLQLVIDELGLD
nr:hypothetical protein [Tanacetum cinerariifolium]